MSITTIAPPAVVTGAARAPLPFGLFSVLSTREPGMTGDRWEGGVQFEALTCEPVMGIGQPQCDPDETVGLPKVLDAAGNEIGEASPFTVYGHFTCAPVGWTSETAGARAEAHLQAREEARVERALWTGDLGNTPNLVTDATVLGSGALSWGSGIGALEAWLGANYGSLGVIHVTRAAAVELLREGYLEVRSGRLVTVLGTPVVAGAGYDGSGPTAAGGGESWAYATPALFGYRSGVFTSSNRAGDLLDRGVNTLYSVAERTYLLGFDPCGHAGVILEGGGALVDEEVQ